MTTMTMTASPGGSRRSVILLAIVLALAAVSMHALVKHGEDAIVASQCADRPELRMTNPQTGRIAFICMTERGWGVAIVEANQRDPVTSFLKEKAKTLQKVVEYLKNSGYELLQ